MSKKRWYRVEVEFKVSGIVFVKEIDKIMAERAVKKRFWCCDLQLSHNKCRCRRGDSGSSGKEN